MRKTRTFSIHVAKLSVLTFMLPCVSSYGMTSDFPMKMSSLAATEAVNFQEKIEVKGAVKEKNASGIISALPHVTVTIKETKEATKADAKGNFSIRMQPGQTLIFRALGHHIREMKVSQSNANLVVYLESNVQIFDEVVITGYQKIDKSKFTGSVSKLDKEIVNRSGYGDVSKMLQGAAAGVSVEGVSGTFGTTPKIRIRGSASISANQEPLYVINGVPIAPPANVNPRQLYSGDPATLLSSAIAGLNANDIEDIQILKDGSATALYGTRAANGVISITTKRGKKEAMNINYSGAFTVGLKPSINQYNVMSSQQQMDLSLDLYNLGYSSVLNYPSSTGAFTEAYQRYAANQFTQEGESPILARQRLENQLNRARNANTDWFDVLFRNNLFQEHSLAFSGGGKSSTYYISGSYGHDDGQAIGYKLSRATNDIRIGLNITPKFDLDFNSNISFRTQNTPGNFDSENSTNTNFSNFRNFELNPSIYAVNTSRAMSPYDENGNLMYYRSNLAPFNILEELRENFQQLQAIQYRIMLKPSYKITDKLVFETLLSVSGSNAINKHVATERSNVAAAFRIADNDVIRAQNRFLYKDPSDPNAIPTTVLPVGGILENTRNDGSSFVARPTLNYRNDWNGGKHNLNVFVGGELGMDKTNAYRDKVYGYQYYSGNIHAPSVLAFRRALDLGEELHTERYISQNRLSAFVNTQYTLLDRYNFEVGGRLDGSNVFGKRTNQKFLPNFSSGFAWNVDKESFFKNLGLNKSINFLKLRASYSLRGNAYQTSPALDVKLINVIRRDAQNNALGAQVLSPELYELTWERDYITNFGMELGFLNRFSITAEYYRRSNVDLINASPVGYEEGFATKTINKSSMYNRGLDLTLEAKDLIKTSDFSWTSGLILGYVKNRVTKNAIQANLLTEVTNAQGFPKVGFPISGLYAYQFAGLSHDSGQPTFYDGQGNVVDNISINSTDASYLKYMGQRDPTLTGSITNTFQYKNFQFRVFLTYSTGNKVFRSPMVFRPYEDNQAVAQDIDARWRIPGNEAVTNIPGLVSTIQDRYFGANSINNEFLYNRSDLMAVDASVLRLNELMLSYELNQKQLAKTPWLKSAKLMLSANNLYFWASPALRGVDPQVLLSGVNLPNPRSFALRIIASF